jgi:hypothetical protein
VQMMRVTAPSRSVTCVTCAPKTGQWTERMDGHLISFLTRSASSERESAGFPAVTFDKPRSTDLLLIARTRRARTPDEAPVLVLALRCSRAL